MNLKDINNKYNIKKQSTKNNCIYVNEEGGDKYSEKNYNLIYEKYFLPYKFEKINILEIGILQGYSLVVHSDYFPNGSLYGYDIDTKPFYNNKVYLESLGAFKNNNIKEIREINSINNIKISNNFKIILDDGDHNPCAQVKTFEVYFPLLEKDGIYIIEDVTNFRLNCLKLYFNLLSIKFTYEKYHETHGSIIIKYQNVDFSKKNDAYNEMNKYKPLIKHKIWWEKQYNKLPKV